MAFKFNTEKPSVKVMDRLELLQAQEELNNAWMNLTDAQKSMEEVCEVMENIQTSVDLITKYGVAGVEQLNVDGSLEALLQVPAKLITAEKAIEALEDEKKNMWQKFKEIIANIFNKLKLWFDKLIADDDEMIKKIESATGFSADDTKYLLVTTESLKKFEDDWNKLTAIFNKLENTELKDTESNITEFKNVLSEMKKIADDSSGVVIFNDVSGKVDINASECLHQGTLEELGFKTIDDAKAFANKYKSVIQSRKANILDISQKLGGKVLSLLASVQQMQNAAGGNTPESYANYVACLKLYATLAPSLEKAIKVMYSLCRKTMVVLAKRCSAEQPQE